MGDFRLVKSLVGDTVEIHNDGVAAEALEEGDLGNFTSSTIEKVDDNDTASDLVLVLAAAASGGTGVPYVWLDPWVEIEGVAKGTVGGLGAMQSIDVTTNVITVETSTLQTTAQFRLRSVENATTKVVRLTRLPNIGVS